MSKAPRSQPTELLSPQKSSLTPGNAIKPFELQSRLDSTVLANQGMVTPSRRRHLIQAGRGPKPEPAINRYYNVPIRHGNADVCFTTRGRASNQNQHEAIIVAVLERPSNSTAGRMKTRPLIDAPAVDADMPARHNPERLCFENNPGLPPAGSPSC